MMVRSLSSAVTPCFKMTTPNLCHNQNVLYSWEFIDCLAAYIHLCEMLDSSHKRFRSSTFASYKITKSPISTTEPQVDNSTSRWILQLNPVSLDVFLWAFNDPTKASCCEFWRWRRGDFTPGNFREVWTMGQKEFLGDSWGVFASKLFLQTNLGDFFMMLPTNGLERIFCLALVRELTPSK